jgi:hypothetical protein
MDIVCCYVHVWVLLTGLWLIIVVHFWTLLVSQTSMKQLDEDIQAFQAKSGLPDELMWEIDRVHMLNRLPIFSSTDVGSDWRGAGEIGERIP